MSERKSEMLERVTRAIRTLRDSSYEEQARAAIEAMREPTKDALEAGNIALDNAIDNGIDSRTDTYYKSVSSSAPYDVYTAMIDAALNAEKPPAAPESSGRV